MTMSLWYGRHLCSSTAGQWSPQGDITSSKTAAAVVAHFDGHHADLVVSDGAPDGRPPPAPAAPASVPYLHWTYRVGVEWESPSPASEH